MEQGDQSSLAMFTRNRNFKISGKILDSQEGQGGSIMFDLDHVHTKSKL